MSYHYKLIIVTVSPGEQDHDVIAQYFYESTPDWYDNVLRPLPRVMAQGTINSNGRTLNKWKTELCGFFNESQAALDEFNANIDQLLNDSRCKAASTVCKLTVTKNGEMVYERDF